MNKTTMNNNATVDKKNNIPPMIISFEGKGGVKEYDLIIFDKPKHSTEYAEDHTSSVTKTNMNNMLVAIRYVAELQNWTKSFYDFAVYIIKGIGCGYGVGSYDGLDFMLDVARRVYSFKKDAGKAFLKHVAQCGEGTIQIPFSNKRVILNEPSNEGFEEVINSILN